MREDTIVGVSTGAVQSGVGIVRLSGKDSLGIVRQIFKGNKTFETHTLTYGKIVHDEKIIDEVMVGVMLAPKSFTKEDVVEINCHGGAACIRAVLELCQSKGARLAEAGEFTKRAFLNGRIDLSQAEAVMDIIEAKTDLSRQAAMNRLQGNLKTKIIALREEILGAIAHIEASIDYPEHDMEHMNILKVETVCNSVINQLEKLIRNSEKGKVIREGIETAIVGKPNVGKSSLMNALLNEERAIVTDIAGTTRDVLYDYVDIGIPLKIIDTAGLRETSDVIEKIGVEKTIKEIENAELVLLLIDGSKEISTEDLQILDSLNEKKKIIIVNKSDLEQKVDLSKLQTSGENTVLQISALNLDGINELCETIKDMFLGKEVMSRDEILVSGIRQKNSLLAANASLKEVLMTIEMGMTEDLLSIDLLAAYKSLGEIIGESLDEDLIDKIFLSFCLGK